MILFFTIDFIINEYPFIFMQSYNKSYTLNRFEKVDMFQLETGNVSLNLES